MAADVVAVRVVVAEGEVHAPRRQPVQRDRDVAHDAPLAARARVSDGNVAERLARSVDDASAQADVTILNTGSADYHSRQLVRVIRNECWREAQ